MRYLLYPACCSLVIAMKGDMLYVLGLLLQGNRVSFQDNLPISEHCTSNR